MSHLCLGLRCPGLHPRFLRSEHNWKTASWVALVDDDTWVNIPQLRAFLSSFDPREPVMFSYVWSDAKVPERQEQGSQPAVQQTVGSKVQKAIVFPSSALEHAT